jgi:hypothetical protein
MAKIRIKNGDMFSAVIDENNKKYFQYVANDLTQLNSAVIRVFKKYYSVNEKPDLNKIINDEIDFYAHVVLGLGIKLKYWNKVGNVTDVGKVDVLFRDSSDYGNPNVKISNNWWIWRINEPMKSVGKLKGTNQRAELGLVISPDSIVHRMRTGKHDFVYPGY